MGRKNCKTNGGVLLGPVRFMDDSHALLILDFFKAY